MTNSLLHGDAPVTVRLIHLGSSIRVEVEDAGRSLPVQGLHDPESMTGRGLALVAALSTSWGIDPGRETGKVVWAELSTNGSGPRHATPPEIAPEAIVASRADQPGPPSYTVRLGGVPTDLLLAAKAHIDNVVRELILLRGGMTAAGTALPPALAALVGTVTGEFGYARAEHQAPGAGRGRRRAAARPIWSSDCARVPM